jgi:hypothetical protein
MGTIARRAFCKWKEQRTETCPLCVRKVPKITRGVSHCGLAIYSEKYLKAKEEL